MPDTKSIKSIAITGSSGFVGRHLVRHLSRSLNTDIRVLVHNKKNIEEFCDSNIVRVEGDLLKRATLSHFPVRDGTVVNLAYIRNASMQENLRAIDNLCSTCAESGIKRLIHCSTAIVVGRVAESVITENTPCRPVTDYEKTKLTIEEHVIQKYSDRFEVIVLRPTVIFGPGGRNLLKMLNSLAKGTRIINYFKSCLYNNRKMSLVSLESVIAAVLFLIRYDGARTHGDVFIISDDEDDMNEYQSIERLFMRILGQRYYHTPVLSIPLSVLRILLTLSGRAQVNPVAVYSSNRLFSEGFRKTHSFEEALSAFARWYITDCLQGSDR